MSVTSRKKDDMCNWISVEERLPGLEDLFFYHDGTIDKGAFYPEQNVFSDYTDDYPIGEVTHWMPLPEPPKEEGEE